MPTIHPQNNFTSLTKTLLLAFATIFSGVFYNFIANILYWFLAEILTTGHGITHYGNSLTTQLIALIPEWIFLALLGVYWHKDCKQNRIDSWHITAGLFSFGYVAGIPLLLFAYYLYFRTMHPGMLDSLYNHERAIFGTGMQVSRTSFPEILIACNALKLTCIPIYFFGCWLGINRNRPRPILPVCSTCQYNLSGTIAANRKTCPECGSEIAPEQMALDIDLNNTIQP